MYEDKVNPTFSDSLLYGLDWDFMMIEVLVIACMDRCQSNYIDGNNAIMGGIAFGVLIAFLFDNILIIMRSRMGKKNIALHTLSSEKFLIS